jgi:TPR repeat protein
MTRCPSVSLLALALCTLATCLGGCASGMHVSAPSSKVSAQTLRSAQPAAESERARESGEAEGWTAPGSLYTQGSRVPQDARQAAALYEKACLAHDADACNNLGHLYLEGLGVGQDAAHAAALYERACMAGLAQGCNNLGLLYASSTQAYGELSLR